jgi:hypothetical protein
MTPEAQAAISAVREAGPVRRGFWRAARAARRAGEGSSRGIARAGLLAAGIVGRRLSGAAPNPGRGREASRALALVGLPKQGGPAGHAVPDRRMGRR